MENYSSRPSIGRAHLPEDVQKLGSDLKGEAAGLADRAAGAAKVLETHAKDALEDLKSAGRSVFDEYASRGKKQMGEAVGRISEYADNNTALIAGGALVVGILLGHILTRKSD